MPWKVLSVAEERLRLVRALLARKSTVLVICRQFGVSRQTGYKYLKRWTAVGFAGLQDQSRRPVRTAAWSAQWLDRLLRLRRRHPTWGARALHWKLKRRGARKLPSIRTLERWLQQAGCSSRPSRRRRAILSRQVRPTPATRANDVWTIDLKGWFCTLDGRKVEPLTVRDLASRFVLWAYPLAPRNEPGVRRVCGRLFRRYGCPRVIRCDLGAPFFGDGPHGFTRLSLWWWRLGIRVEFVRRGCINNNAHEQMHGILSKEVPICANRTAQARALEQWRCRYNHQRPHQALGMQLPAALYRPSPAALPALSLPQYPKDWLVRWVARNGDIYIPTWRGSIGRAFAHLPVGLKPVSATCYRVYFGSLLLGELDWHRSSKLIVPPVE